jgi:hypothetical protein
MKTYNEEFNNETFDWNGAIESALKNDIELDGTAHDKLVLKAESWVTCACGNQCAIIPRELDGTPYDDTLRRLGIDFMYLITAGHWNSAKLKLEQIEFRSAEIIRQIEEDQLQEIDFNDLNKHRKED